MEVVSVKSPAAIEVSDSPDRWEAMARTTSECRQYSTFSKPGPVKEVELCVYARLLKFSHLGVVSVEGLPRLQIQATARDRT